MTKQVVFCDFDGPIVDVSERYYQTYQQGLRAIASIYAQDTKTALPISPLSKHHFWQMKQNRMADIEIAIRSGIPASWFDPFIQIVKQIVNHPSLLLCDQLQPSAWAALQHIQQANMRLVLVTLRHPQQVDAFLHQQGMAHLVDEVYGLIDMNAAYVNQVEQKCDLLAQAIAQQKVKGYRTHTSWMIGDTEADIIAARGMGLSAAALTCGVRSKSYLQKLEPTAIYDELLSAAKAAVQRANLQVASL